MKKSQKRASTRTKTPSLKQMISKYPGRDPITQEKIEVGDQIFYDTESRKAFKGDNIFAAAGDEYGKLMMDAFNQDIDQDPVALLGAISLLKERGELEDPEAEMRVREEAYRWASLISLDTLSPAPPSALMLIEALGGSEEMREKLEKQLNGSKLEKREDYASDDPDLDRALKNLLSRLDQIGDPRETYSKGARCWWTDFGAVSVTSHEGMNIRAALQKIDLKNWVKKKRAEKIKAQ